jgi:hypothetical protein
MAILPYFAHGNFFVEIVTEIPEKITGISVYEN